MGVEFILGVVLALGGEVHPGNLVESTAAWRRAAGLSGSAWKAISAAPGGECKFVVTERMA